MQMLTQEGKNVNVTAVRGNFDDAQSGVKVIFADQDFNEQLAKKGVKLSSANSINWGRLVPQIVYYFSAYADLRKNGRIAAGEEVNFTVPTGNFGNILAGFYAKKMGLPVYKLICASNANNVLTDFLQTGRYDRNRAFYKTITPSMDILISSNLERLLYHVTGNKAQVAGWMAELNNSGSYEVDVKTRGIIKETFWADWVDDAATKKCIQQVYLQHKYVLDTHTAVAYQVAENYRHATHDEHVMVVASTASPYKFNGSVLDALQAETAGLDEFALLDKLQELNDNPIPAGLAALKTKEVLHKGVCDKDKMNEAVMNFIAR
jgi:threonine synthase